MKTVNRFADVLNKNLALPVCTGGAVCAGGAVLFG